MPPSSSLARSASPAAAKSHRADHEMSLEEEIPRLAYDSLSELEEMFGRWRDQLRREVQSRWAELGGRKSGKTLEQAQKDVLETFFEPLVPILLSNCTIAGLRYEQYKQQMPQGETEPFQDDLHYQVVDYQNQLFDAREDNVNARRNEPLRIAGNLETLIGEDNAHFDALLNAPELKFAAPVVADASAGKKKGRKSVASGGTNEGPTAKQAREDFDVARNDVARLLRDAVALNTKAEAATQVALDARALA